MYTSLVLIALSSGVAQAEASAPALTWQKDYASAYEKAHQDQKPIAVIVGSGSKGWDKLSKEGQLGKDVCRLLEAHYLCVYVDTSKEAGKRLADSFEMSQGVVLSDRGGDNQKFRHEGELANDDLERQLRRHGGLVVSASSDDASESRSYYSPVQNYAPAAATYAPSYAPSYAPAAPSYAPRYAPSFAPSFGGGGCSSCHR